MPNVAEDAPAAAGSRWPVRALLVAVAAAGYAADQTSKAWALAHLTAGVTEPAVGRALLFHLTFNPGAAFSMGSGSTVVFTMLAVVAVLVLAGGVAPRVCSRGSAVFVGLALAGVGGNLTDRLVRAPGPLRGHVVDFLAFPAFPRPLRLGSFELTGWPIFNVADALLCTAVGLMVVLSLVADRRERHVRAERVMPEGPAPEKPATGAR